MNPECLLCGAMHNDPNAYICQLCARELQEKREARFKPNPQADPVHHPPHYKANGMEAIDVIEAFGLSFSLGNALKYILRSGRKGTGDLASITKEDLSKAVWYLQREIERLSK